MIPTVMSRIRSRWFTCVFMVAGLSLARLSAGDTPAEFDRAVADASSHYRSAMFYLRTKNTDVAAIELMLLQQKWREVMQRFASSPPTTFAKDSLWHSTLTGIAGNIDRAIAATNKGDLDRSRQDLMEIRRSLSRLYQRNGVPYYPDRIDELRAAIARLARYIKNPPNFSSAEQTAAVTRATAAVADLTRKCREHAPPEYRESEEFRRLVQGMLESVALVKGAIEQKNVKGVRDNIRAVRSYDEILFLRFG
jgi:soluble cytochrome b562